MLLNNFFNSAKDVINDDGRIIVSLVGGQSGTSASNTEEWNRSFKLIQHVSHNDTIQYIYTYYLRARNDVECPALVDNNFRSSEPFLMIPINITDLNSH